MNSNKLILFFLLCLAAFIYLPNITQRPLHVDEAVNAYILGTLIETGQYTYDPTAYHGPTLYYCSSVLTNLLHIYSYQDLTVLSLRLLPVFCGFGIIVMIFLLGNIIRDKAGIIAALIALCSPILIYFNRYYIHESMLVFFSLAIIYTGIRLPAKKPVLRAILFGIALGSLIATKETWILYILAMGISLIILRYLIRDIQLPDKQYMFIAIGTTIITIIILFTSLFTNFSGLSAFLASFPNYFYRGTATPEHTYAWYYYIELILFYKIDYRWFMSEIFILIIMIPGYISVFKNKSKSGIFLAYYTVIFLLIFSMIPYKTPWNILGLIPGLAILGGAGMLFIWDKIKTIGWKSAYISVILILISFQVHEALAINFIYHSDPANPYTYGHARDDVNLIGPELELKLKNYPDVKNIRIDIIAENGGYWPLPWYLRSFSNVAWWSEIPQKIHESPVVLISPELESEFIDHIYNKIPIADRNLYVPLFDRDMELRPEVYIRGYIRYDVWQRIGQ